MDMKEYLKTSCIELYGFPDDTNKNEIITFFQGSVKDAHRIDASCHGGNEPVWILLCVNFMAAQGLCRQQNVPYKCHSLTVRPCTMSDSIPTNWLSFLQNTSEMAGGQFTGNNYGASPAGLYNPYIGSNPEMSPPVSQGPGMAYPQQPFSYPNQGNAIGASEGQTVTPSYTAGDPTGTERDSTKTGTVDESKKADDGTQEISKQSENTAVPSSPNQIQYPLQQMPDPNFSPQHPPSYQQLYPGGNVNQQTPAMQPHQAQMQMFSFPQMGQYIQYPSGIQHPVNPYNMQQMTSPWQPQTEPHPQQVQIKEKEKTDGIERGKVNSANRIVVTKLPRNVTEERLKSFFKSRKSSGGGKINSLEMKEDHAIVTFRDSSVVERVLQKIPLLFEDKQIHVEKYFSDSDSDESSEDDNTDTDESDDDKEECSCTIEVRGMTDKTTPDTVEMYFESKRAGGGAALDIVKFEFDEEERFARVKFQSEKEMREVLARQHRVDGAALQVTEYIPAKVNKRVSKEVSQNTSQKETCSCTIEVRGMTDKTTPDTVEMYFESKRAGGGATLDIVKFEFDEEERFARVTYKTEEDMKKVLTRQHKIDGASMQLKEYIPPKPRPLYDDKVILKGVNPNTSKDGLMNFLEAKTNAIPTDLTYGEEEGIVLVSFEEPPDFQKLEQACQKRKMDGNILKLSRVPISNCVMVTGIATTTGSDTLQYYFENARRSGGGDIEKIVHNQGDDTCLLYFEDHKVVDSVCKKKHTIDSQQLSVKMYHPMLGETTDDGPSLKIPEAITISTIDERILQFLLSSSKNQEALQMQLQDIHAHIVWPDTRTSPIKVECILTKQVKNCRKLAKSWRKDVHNNVQQFVQQITANRIPVLQNAWDQIMRCLQEKTIKNPDGVAVVVEKITMDIVVIGYTDFAQDLANEIKLDIKRIEEELEKQKQRITENVTIKHYQLLLICKKNFVKDVQSKYTAMKVKTDMTKRQVTFEGSTVDVLKAKVEMLGITSSIVSSEAGHFSKLSLQLLDQSKTKAYISQKMKDDSIEAVWETEKGTMTVYAMTDKDAVKATHILKKSILESKIPVKKESQQLLFSDLWDSHVEDIKVQRAQYPVEIEWNPTDGNITVCCVDEDKGLVLELVQDFLEANTIVEAKLQIHPGILKFLQQSDRQSKIQKIAKEMKQDHVKIEMSKIEIVIKGTSVGLQKATQRVNALIQKVQNKKYTLEKPGITKLMESDTGQSKLARVEQMMHVSIVPDDMEDSDDEQTAQRGELVQEIARCERKKYSVMVMLGDVTELETDMLINSSNENLQHSGGLAKAIVDKGGLQIQQDCDNHIRQLGKKMSAGDVYYGRPGSLKCKMLSHAVCPAWQGGNKNEEYLLADIVLECLEEGTSQHYESIAIPALGTGTFGFPIKDATKIIINAVKEYFSDDQVNSNIKKVYLCDVRRETVDAFTEELIGVYGQRKVQLVSNSADSQNWSTRKVKSRQPTRQRSQTDDDSHGFVIPADCEYDGNTPIRLVKGEISKQKVDVIVNTVGLDLNLRKGAVASSLLKGAGKGLQDECNQSYPNGLNPGEIAVTAGHKLKCKIVCHGALPQWGGGDDALQPLRTLMGMCLKEAVNRKLTSIAFPALGTGNLGYPKNVVAREMYRIASQFTGTHADSSLKSISFIVYQQDHETIKAFEEESSRRKSSPRAESASKPTGRQSRQFKAHTEVEIETVTLDVGQLQLKIYQGDITTLQIDAIVNSTNAEFDLTRGAVANAIKMKGGKDLEGQINLKRKEMKTKGIALTTSGGLSCKFVVHLNCEERTKSDWKGKVMLALGAAEDSGNIKSLAFPALGTGINEGPTIEDAARYFFDAVMEFQSSTDIQDLKEVHIVIFQEDMVERFMIATKSCFSGYKSSKQIGLGTKFMNLIKGTKKEEGLAWKPTYNKITIPPSSYPVVIYGDNNDDIDKAFAKLEDSLDDEFKRKEFRDKVIKNFTEKQEKVLQRLEKRFNVDVKFEKRLGRIQLFGLPDNVADASDEIHDLIRKVEKERQAGLEAELIADMVEWSCVEITSKGSELIPYPPHINRMLEKAYRNQESTVTFSDKTGVKYDVDLDTLEEREEDNPSSVVKVIRKNKGEDMTMDLPSDWKEMADADNLLVVPLANTDQEYQNVVAEFNRTVGSPRTIHKVERVQNRTLYRQYVAKKKQMDKQNPQGTTNERLLWHGMAPDSVASINAHGFNRSYCGKNATAYGNGVYFAVNAQYSSSATYSKPDANGHQRMYYCRVLTGEFTQGAGGMRVPPQKPNAPAHVLYDSVANNVANPIMFIIFNDTQAYPDYIVTFY